MIQLKNPRLLIFIILGAVLITVTFLYFVNFNIPEEHVPQPKKIQERGGAISPPTTPPPGTSATSEAAVKITIKGDEFSFSPVSFKVSRGAKVELTFENVGNIPHNFWVDELGLKTKTIGSGQADTISFTAPNVPSTITYASYCSVPGHREAGMKGTIIIE